MSNIKRKIMNGEKIVGFVVETLSGKDVIVIHDPNINILSPLRICDNKGQVVVDEDIIQSLMELWLSEQGENKDE